MVEGIIGKALKFDGINDYVEINPSFLLKPQEITLEAWVFPLKQNLGSHKHYMGKILQLSASDSHSVGRGYALQYGSRQEGASFLLL